MASISLLRANPALTTNVKLVVDRKYNLFLESYSANITLSDEKYKYYRINSESFISQKIASFFYSLPSEIAFDTANTISSNSIQDDFEYQYDDIYYSGPRIVEDIRYDEEFQYNTTLKIDPLKLPKYFFIFRVDDAGIYESDINKISDFIDDFQIIETFDLSDKTKLGELLTKNYINDDKIYPAPLEINLKEFEFSKFNGYNFTSGGTVSKSLFLNDIFSKFTSDYLMEDFLTSNYEKNEVICSNFLNVSFLYNDTVVGLFESGNTYLSEEYPMIKKLIKLGIITDDKYTKILNNGKVEYTFNENIPYKKEWTINRYNGYYIDELKFINKLSSYISPQLKYGENIVITNNIFKDSSGNDINPFITTMKVTDVVYIKIGVNYYRVILSSSGEYIIISDVQINDTLDNIIDNQEKSVKIEFGTIGTKLYPVIKYYDNTQFVDNKLNKILDYNNVNKKSIIAIKIDDVFYRLKKHIDGTIYLLTDKYIEVTDKKIIRTEVTSNSSVNNDKDISILLDTDTITYFEIYELHFTKIGDFDVDRVNTDFTKIEYDKKNVISYNRPGMYLSDIKSNSIPKNIIEENLTLKFNGVVIPDSTKSYYLPSTSEYAIGDLYALNNLNTLSIWNLNQTTVKWGISKSINNMCYPYKINNSTNFVPNYKTEVQSISDMNLDYFYTLYKPLNSDGNIITNIVSRSLNIDLDYTTKYDAIRFDIDYYKSLNAKFDFFKLLFSKNVDLYNDGLYDKQKKYSTFLEDDGVNGSSTFMRGLNVYFKWCKLLNPNTLDLTTAKFINGDISNYDFAVLLTPRYTEDVTLHGKAGIEFVLNNVYKNLLVNIYIYTPKNSILSSDFNTRDNLYTNDNIQYSVYNTNTSSYDFIDSEITPNDITLNKFLQYLKTYNDSKLEISIDIVEDVKYYTPNNWVVNGNEISINIGTHNFKEGDWVFIDGYDKNIQISKRIGNDTIIIEPSNIISAPSNIRKEKSVCPFILKAITPDKLKIRKYVEFLKNDLSPVTPNINTQNILDIDITNNNGVVPYIYNNDSISRIISKNNIDLTYNEIQQLPEIERVSGLYEPIIKEIEVFNSYELTKIESIQFNSVEIVSGIIKIHTASINTLNVDDIIYIKDSILPEISYRFANIIDINNGTITIDITTNAADNVLVGNSNIELYYITKNNTKFDLNYRNFGIIKNVNIIRVFEDINPLKTNKYGFPNVFPMIDEIGIDIIDKNIFMSPWDINYFHTTILNNI